MSKARKDDHLSLSQVLSQYSDGECQILLAFHHNRMDSQQMYVARLISQGHDVMSFDHGFVFTDKDDNEARQAIEDAFPEARVSWSKNSITKRITRLLGRLRTHMT